MLSRILRLLNLRRDHNPGRELAQIGHERRRAATREAYKATHDAMRSSLGLPAIQWKD